MEKFVLRLIRIMGRMHLGYRRCFMLGKSRLTNSLPVKLIERNMIAGGNQTKMLAEEWSPVPKDPSPEARGYASKDAKNS